MLCEIALTCSAQGLWSRRVGCAVPGFPLYPRVPGRAHPKLAVAELRLDKLPSPTPLPKGRGLWTPPARRRPGYPETFPSAVSAKAGWAGGGEGVVLPANGNR